MRALRFVLLARAFAAPADVGGGLDSPGAAFPLRDGYAMPAVGLGVYRIPPGEDTPRRALAIIVPAAESLYIAQLHFWWHLLTSWDLMLPSSFCL